MSHDIGNPSMDTSVPQPSNPSETVISKNILPFLCHVALPTAIGALIYLLFRATSLLVFEWIDAVHLLDEMIAIRRCFQGANLPNWAIYSLPDGLWVYAVTSWVILIWRGNPPVLWLLVGVVLGLGGELGQAVSIVPGTYQHLDMLFYITGFILACLQLEQKNETSLLFHIRIAGYDRVRFRER